MTNVKLKIAEAIFDDMNRGIARIDKTVMKQLRIKAGEYVKIEGKKSSIFIADEAHAGDIGLEVIRIDGIGRKNVDTVIGEFAVITKAIGLVPAKKVVIAPAQDNVKVKADERFFKYSLLKKCVQRGDFVGLRGAKRTKQSFSNEGFFDSVFNQLEGASGFSKDLKFTIVDTVPKGAVIVDENTEIISKETAVKKLQKLEVTYDDIGGMKEEIQRLREMVELPLRHPEIFNRLGIDPPKGLLLHGPPGTGKTLLAKAVASETNCHFEVINGPEIMSAYFGGSEGNLRKIFESAKENAPSIIFIDELDSIAPKRDDLAGGNTEARVVAQLLACMDGLKERGKIVVIAATNRPNSIDPALRRPGRFDRELLIGVPNDKTRHEILQIHSRRMPLKGVDLKVLSEKTYGFVGADLESLCRESAMGLLREFLPSIKISDDVPIPEKILKKMVIKPSHFDDAMRIVRPSAMREVMIETPTIGWKDIGGLEEIKQQLKESVEWPLKHPESFKTIGIRPPKGTLLYGPPGVGKTMLGKAIAKECDANFILIKGPEIFSMWVGESEKNIRKIFQRARQVSPAIIFFDEIDSLATNRGSGGTGSSEVGSKVVNQLLTEIDGLEEIKGISIIASTNRPDLIDAALLRPGRFDRIIYTPTPDEAGREKILIIHTKKMSLAKDVNIKEIVSKTKDFVGADIEFLCIEAGILALRENIKAKEVKMKHFIKAFDSVFPSVDPDIENQYKDFNKVFRKSRSKEVRDELQKVINYVG